MAKLRDMNVKLSHLCIWKMNVKPGYGLQIL